MEELEKMLEEINGLRGQVGGEQTSIDIQMKSVLENCIDHVKNIIRKYMNDGWIPVKERLPEPNKKVLATIVHHKWISDYDSAWVPEDEKTVHEAWVETSEVVCISGKGFLYRDSECDFTSSYAQIKPEPDMSRPVDEVVAWRPLPEPYHSEQN